MSNVLMMGLMEEWRRERFTDANDHNIRLVLCHVDINGWNRSSDTGCCSSRTTGSILSYLLWKYVTVFITEQGYSMIIYHHSKHWQLVLSTHHVSAHD